MKQGVREFFNKVIPEEIVPIMTFTGASLLGPVKELFNVDKRSKKSIIDDSLAYFMSQDCMLEKVAYNIALLNGELMEDSTEIKKYFSAKANKRLQEMGVKARIIVHLQYKKSSMFADKQSTVMGLFLDDSRKDFEFQSNHCYIMEIDNLRNIHNIILDTTKQEMINLPSWYSPEIEKKKEDA